MSDWGQRTYGQPCRGCGFSWEIDPARARVLVADLPLVLTSVLVHARGDERHPDLGWTVTAYVAHVGDNLRIWAERIAGITRGAPRAVAPYDSDDLARARGYDAMALESAHWTLGRAVHDWLAAVDGAPRALTLVHPDRGEIGLDDVVRTNAHDAVHHTWDILRSLRP